jgi:hypothetical protein
VNLDRHLTAFCESRVGRAINLSAMWATVGGSLSSAALAVAVIFGHATATNLGVALLLTGAALFTYVLTE